MQISKKHQDRSIVVNIWNIFWAVVWILLISVLLLRLFVFQQVNVVGKSMESNYFQDEMLVVNIIDKPLERGQVVAVYADKDIAKDANRFTPYLAGTRFFLKRVIALPGERVQMIQNKVIIFNDENPEGIILEEDYIDASIQTEQITSNYYFEEGVIPEDHYFLLGDNRTNSTDSRSASSGPFPEYSIFGTETVKYWPLQEFRLFDLPEYSYSEVSDELRAKGDELQSQNGQVR